MGGCQSVRPSGGGRCWGVLVQETPRRLVVPPEPMEDALNCAPIEFPGRTCRSAPAGALHHLGGAARRSMRVAPFPEELWVMRWDDYPLDRTRIVTTAISITLPAWQRAVY